jgi:hypothetical protein
MKLLNRVLTSLTQSIIKQVHSIGQTTPLYDNHKIVAYICEGGLHVIIQFNQDDKPYYFIIKEQNEAFWISVQKNTYLGTPVMCGAHIPKEIFCELEYLTEDVWQSLCIIENDLKHEAVKCLST